MQQPSSGNEEILETSLNQMFLKFQTDVSVMGFEGLCSDPRGNAAVKTHRATGSLSRKTITFLSRERLPGTSLLFSGTTGTMVSIWVAGSWKKGGTLTDSNLARELVDSCQGQQGK